MLVFSMMSKDLSVRKIEEKDAAMEECQAVAQCLPAVAMASLPSASLPLTHLHRSGEKHFQHYPGFIGDHVNDGLVCLPRHFDNHLLEAKEHRC